MGYYLTLKKTNKFDDANAILKIANMKTDKEFNDYIKAQGLKGTQREKMLKSLYDAEKNKEKTTRSNHYNSNW